MQSRLRGVCEQQLRLFRQLIEPLSSGEVCKGYSERVGGGGVATLHPSAHAPADCRCTASTGACGNAPSALHSLHRPTTQHVEIGRRAPLCQPVIPHILSTINPLLSFPPFLQVSVTRNPRFVAGSCESVFFIQRLCSRQCGAFFIGDRLYCCCYSKLTLAKERT